MLAQALFGFELASIDPRVAEINLVGSEDNYAAMADYADHMQIFQLVRGLYPNVQVSMHARRVNALGSFPRRASAVMCARVVEVAGTDRIGHGVDVTYEQDPEKLLKDMAAKQVLVEINLTSNEDMLGVQRLELSLPDPSPVRRGRRRSPPTTKASSASTSPTNMSARPRATISAVRPT